MEDLFEKLKAEPPVNNSKDEKSDSELASKKICTDDISVRSKKSVSPVFKPIKSRSNSPNNNGKHSKASPVELNSIDSNSEAPEKRNRRSPSRDSDSKEAEDATNENALSKKCPKKQMPTKAQQKLFETPPKDTADGGVDKSTEIDGDEDEKNATGAKTKDHKVKRCRVRIKRQDLVKLRAKFAREQASKMSKKKKVQENKNQNKIDSPAKPLQKAGNKRKADTGGSPPTKKGKTEAKTSPPGKKSKTSGFFIKLGSNSKKSAPTPKDKPYTAPKKLTSSPKEKILRKTPARVANTTPLYTTKATKFTRSQLIRTFGKRYFNSRVKIERCRHPMMLTFESNARARRLQSKNKSKNLTVSFKEQVEIIGLSDTESYESDDVNVAHGAANDPGQKLLAGATPLHLKKVENGKVIDDIEFDPSLFGDPNTGNNSSTPLRKKKDKKSYSPLKDDSSSSARSELLKSANEKLPPSALRCLSADDEDDEDDECEWIVPIDIPERRSSRTNSASDKEGKDSTTDGELGNGKSVVPPSENVQTEAIDQIAQQEMKDEIKKPNEMETTKSAENKSPERLNGDEAAENGKTSSEEKKSKNSDAENISKDVDKSNSSLLVLENDSNPPFTPEAQASPDLLKTTIDKLSEDIEKSENDCNQSVGKSA